MRRIRTKTVLLLLLFGSLPAFAVFGFFLLRAPSW